VLAAVYLLIVIDRWMWCVM